MNPSESRVEGSTIQPRMPDRCDLLFGRDNELGALRSLVANAPDPGGALVIVGDAGTGKTALLRGACADAQIRGYEVLFALGDLARLDVPFSGLHPMLRHFGTASDRLAAADRRTLAHASQPGLAWLRQWHRRELGSEQHQERQYAAMPEDRCN